MTPTTISSKIDINQLLEGQLRQLAVTRTQVDLTLYLLREREEVGESLARRLSASRKQIRSRSKIDPTPPRSPEKKVESR